MNGNSDQERPPTAVLSAVKATWESEWVPARAPKQEKASNGEVDRAVQTVHRLARTRKEHVYTSAQSHTFAGRPQPRPDVEGFAMFTVSMARQAVRLVFGKV